MRRPFESTPVSAPPQGGLDAEGVSAFLLMIPEILAGLGEVRRILDGRSKSHYTVEEVAGLTGRAPYTVRTWIKEGRVRATRVSATGPKGRLLVAREELQKLVTAGMADRMAAGASGGGAG